MLSARLRRATQPSRTSLSKTETCDGAVENISLHQTKTETDFPPVSPEEEKKLVRKIDRHLMPLLLISYALQFFDKTTLGYTAILGIQKDTHLTGSDYSWISSIFYFGYLIASYPASFAFVKFPIGKFLALCVIIWAVVLGCHGAATNFGSLMALRFLLGVFEASISPGFSLVTALWYKPAEHASRHGIWFAGNQSAAMVGGLLAYAISHIKTNVAAWRWLFIIFSLVTFVWGLVLLFLLPDSPLTARFLSKEERPYAHRRPQQTTRSFPSKEWKRGQFIEALIDPKTWLLCIYSFCTSLPNGGFTAFNSIIIQGFGFDTFTTLLLGMPGSAFGLAFVLISAFLAHKLKYSRCLTCIGNQLIALVGTIMVYKVPLAQKWTRLGGLWLMTAFAAGFPLILSIIASDIAGYTKKTTVLAIMFISYCAGNIAGPQLFLAKEAPRYDTAFESVMISLVIAAFSMIVLRQYMVWDNKRRDREQGVHIDPEASDQDDNEERLVHAGLDDTDWANRKFRYIL